MTRGSQKNRRAEGLPAQAKQAADRKARSETAASDVWACGFVQVKVSPKPVNAPTPVVHSVGTKI